MKERAFAIMLLVDWWKRGMRTYDHLSAKERIHVAKGEAELVVAGAFKDDWR